MSNVDKPTSKQLAYLRSLAASRGQTFQYPTNRAQASREIQRLLGGKPDSRVERSIEREHDREITSEGLDATRIREDEVGGWGSSAHWRS